MTEYNAALCPECNGKAKIDHMRNGPRGTTRRRTCVDCGHAFFSLEQRYHGPEREDSGINSTTLIELAESLGIPVDQTDRRPNGGNQHFSRRK